MRVLKAFIARSFQKADDDKIKPIEDILNSFSPLGLTWDTAERAEIESVSKKVQQKIDECDVFVAVFTRRHPIFKDVDTGDPGAREPISWTGPPWLFQESGYALKAGKRLMLFLESGVELPNLQGDLEYIPYDPEHPAGALLKSHQMLVGLISKNVGVITEHSISAAEPTTTEEPPAVTDSVVVPASISPISLNQCFRKLFDAKDQRDYDKIKELEKEGTQLILAGADEGVDEITWRCLCLFFRGDAGDVTAIQGLQDISIGNPDSPEPLRALAQIARSCGEHRSAGDWYSKAADVAKGSLSLRIHAAQSFRAASRWDLAIQQLEAILRGDKATDSVKAEALQEMFWGLKNAGDSVGAFCFGEAALSILPNDSDFRFHLAYAYGDTNGGHQEHDYRDLALYHYRVLVSQDQAAYVSRNNLGVAYDNFEAPIHAVEQFTAASEGGNALATANVIRQYLRSGLVSDAKKWAEQHEPAVDERGHVAQALAALHSDRHAEETKLEQVLKHEVIHRTALAKLGEAARSGTAEQIAGKFKFPVATLDISTTGDSLKGEGENQALGDTKKHRLAAKRQNNIWRFAIESRNASDSIWSTTTETYGLLVFSADSSRASVLEYQSDGVIAAYEVARTEQ